MKNSLISIFIFFFLLSFLFYSDMKFKNLFRKSYEHLIFVPMDKLWNLSYEGLRKLCCPSALITHDSSLVEENEAEAHRRSVRCKIKRLLKIRELRNMN